MSMKAIVGITVVAAAAAAAGYWYGVHKAGAASAMTASMGPAAAAPAADGGRKILYYRNPMGLPDTSPTPKKDSMGMDYIPVYEGEDTGGSGIKVSDEKIQRLGVRVAAAEERALDAVVRASGRIEVNERRLATVTSKFEGYIERLYVNATGESVARGAPLFDAYSPELLAAQREYVVAVQGLAKLKDADEAARAGMQRLADSALARLRLWDVTDTELARLAAGGEPRRTLKFTAPAGGTVLERKATQGMRFMPGEPLFTIADLGTVWLIADVPEQDIGRVRIGARARALLEAYPGETFDGRVTFVYPTLREQTRSAQVRIEMPNPRGRLKPAMYAQIEIEAGGAPVLAVPTSALIDNGSRRVVLVDKGEGRFEPRDVKTGRRGDEFTEIVSGITAGERVVVSANFLLDSEANLKAALGALTGGSNAGKVSHRAVGTLDDVDAAAGTLLISHEPVPSLNWPKMTMEFVPSNEAVAKAARPGEAIEFDFVERKPGEWVVTKIDRRGVKQ